MRSLWNSFSFDLWKEHKALLMVGQLEEGREICDIWAEDPGFWALFNDTYKQQAALVFTSLDYRIRRGMAMT